MGKIIRNGVEYSASPSEAKNIAYSNSTSGLANTNVQGAIDELNSTLPKKKTITATTNSSGLIGISTIGLSPSKVIVGIRNISQDYGCTITPYQTSNSGYGVRITDTNGAILANFAITFEIYYIDAF